MLTNSCNFLLMVTLQVDPAVIHEEDYFQRLENLVENTKDKRGYNELKVRFRELLYCELLVRFQEVTMK